MLMKNINLKKKGQVEVSLMRVTTFLDLHQRNCFTDLIMVLVLHQHQT